MDLQKKWYKILKEAGFDDIEFYDYRTNSYSVFMKRDTTNLSTSYNGSSEEYYRLAREWVHTQTFESPTDKAVWTYHSEGLSYDNILKHFPLWRSRSPIQRIIKKQKKLLLRAIEIQRSNQDNEKENQEED